MTINKITKSPTPTELIKKVNELVDGVNTGGGGGGIPVGHVYTIGYSELDAGQLPLLGGEYSRTTYSDLWAWVQSKPSLLKTESEWQALKTASGNKGVPYYSAGNGTTTFRVPMFGSYVKGASSMDTVGDFLAAGLPNIQGEIAWSDNAGGLDVWRSAAGVFARDRSDVVSSMARGPVSLNQGGNGRISLDASLNNSIYGNSNTVTPDSIIQLYVVQAFGEVTNVGSTDVAAIAVGLQELETNKMNADCSNLTAGGITNLQNALKLGFAIIYPNGGTEASPANVTVNSRYVLTNPFGTANVLCVAELYYQNKWCQTGWAYSTAGSVWGTIATQLFTSGDIIVQTGINNIIGGSPYTGNGFGDSSINLTTAQCRVKVWRCSN